MLRLLPATASCTNLVQENQFPEQKPAHFDFFAISFTVWSHILSTVGDALRSSPRVLSIGRSTLQLDEEKLTFAGLDQENGFFLLHVC